MSNTLDLPFPSRSHGISPTQNRPTTSANVGHGGIAVPVGSATTVSLNFMKYGPAAPWPMA
jgi:hypothetical protein